MKQEVSVQTPAFFSHELKRTTEASGGTIDHGIPMTLS